VCLPIADYSREEQTMLANEIQASNGAIFPSFIADYLVLRNQVRAMCE